MVKNSVKHKESNVKDVKKTMISTLKFQYVDFEKEIEAMKLQEEMRKKAEDSDYEPPKMETTKIDFKNPVINETQEVNIKLHPTYGVTFDKVKINETKFKGRSVGIRESPHKIIGKKYTEIPNLKSKLTLTQYKELRKNKDSVDIVKDKVLVKKNKSSQEATGLLISDDIDDHNFISVEDQRFFDSKEINIDVEPIYSDQGGNHALPNIDSRAYKAGKMLIDHSFNYSVNPNSATNKSIFSEKVIPDRSVITSKYADLNRFRSLKTRK